jgi:hypothetical protein
MSPNWANHIHEALAVIATFAYSQAPLEKLRRKRFPAECLFLEKSSMKFHDEQRRRL